MSERAPRPVAVARPEPGRVLVVAPHADDELVGCGGTLALHLDQGDAVRVLVVFDGVLGVLDGRGARAAARLRRAEALRAGRALRGTGAAPAYTFWGYPEGHEPTPLEFEGAVRRLASELDRDAPQTLYVPWLAEHHLDHHLVARATLEALGSSDFGGVVWGYEVWTPLVAQRVVDVSGVAARKRSALAAHRSQHAAGDLSHRSMGLAAQRSAYLPGAARYGEAFVPLSPAARALVRGAEAA